ncbi:MAG: hypothetical protein PWQ93_101 [Clostridiales bacterium]|nr:hypothetical protein [Clostridiales bacterium]
MAGITIHNNNTVPVDISSLPIEVMEGSFVYDTDNVQEAVGMVDYVFAGNVLSNDGTHYKDIVTMEDENGRPKEVGTPYTDFTVQVLNNIKRELQTDNPIKLVKHGGVGQNQKSVFVFENDCIPKKGQTYIFLAYAQPDGSLLVSGPNSNILVNSFTKTLNSENVETTSEFKIYKSAFENEIIPVERKRYTSVYEE